MEIRISSCFERKYKKLPKHIKLRAKEREWLFLKNPFDPRLETHKLHGKYKNAWAYSVDYSYRIIFMFIDEDKVFYLDVGTHDEIYE